MLRRPKRDERPLIIQERPMLSDDVPEDPEQPQKKKSWRKRLFGKKSKKGSSYDSDDRGNEYEVPKLSKSSSSTSAVPAPPAKQPNPADPEQPQQQQSSMPSTEQAREKREPKQEKRDDSITTADSSTAPKDPEPQQQRPHVVRPDPIQSDEPPTKNDSQKFVQLDLASPQPTVMSTFSKKKTPRAKGGADIKKIYHGPAAPPATVALLKRPFGRDSLAASQQWIVQISAAEWEPKESLWKYRIALQKRTPDKVQDAGSTFRSIMDFVWLERSLQAEFHGGLLLPNLSIALGVPDLSNCQHEVDARLLTNWLSDVLNGVRGQGELIYTPDKQIDLMSSESMEAFMYRIELKEQIQLGFETPLSPTSPRDRSLMDDDDEAETKAWNWIYPELCASVGCVKPTESQQQQQQPLDKPKPKLALRKMNCASAALGDARSFNVQDSFVETPTFDTAHHVPMAIHSEILKAEKDLVWSWRTKALRVMEKMRVLQEQEKHVASAWKRFAISVSNLFAYEKDVESAKLGDSKTRQNLQMPFRKLQKSAVDDALRILAKNRVERSTPSLDALGLMLSAYVADLSAVQPAVQSYLEGLEQLAIQQEKCEQMKQASQNKQTATGLASQIQAGILDLKKQLGTTANDDSVDFKSQEKYQLQKQQTHMLESRVLLNEALLKDFLTTLCCTTLIRTSRMAYNYFYIESRQCSFLHGAAIGMQGKINVASKENLAKMISRHHKESSGDRAVELLIVQRIVNLNNTKKFLKDDPSISEEVEKGVEINKDGVGEDEKAKLRDKALELSRERVGRWDAKVALAMMEAVGVTDANVRVEETTRDLRMVRKYAIGLRENVQRCTEALANVRQAVLQGEFGDIRDLRHDFVAEIQELFSAVYVPVDDIKTPPAPERLERVGIRLNDPYGWKRTDEGTCGGATKRYMENREESAEWLLDSLEELLKDYNQRIEAVESFVYMECVGIQLEKNFSQKRAAALAAFEKKTDITSAINIATRKRMPALLKELQAKLADVGADVSHTTVKEAKEAHLESKKLKEELHELSLRRLSRSQETSTERAIALMTLWAKEDEGTSNTELSLLQNILGCLERSLGDEEVADYLEVSPGS